MYLLLFFGMMTTSKAQRKEADSLSHVLKKLSLTQNYQADTIYLNTLNALSFRLSYLKADSAIMLAGQAAELSHKAGFPFGEAEAYKNLGLALSISGDYDSALAVFRRGLEITEKNGLDATTGRIYHNSAIVNINLGKYSEALENYFLALKMRELSGEILGQSSSTNGIGTVYFLQGNYPEAARYYQQAMELAKTIDYKPGIEAGYSNMGEVYFRLGQYDSAKINLSKALEVTRETENLEVTAFCSYMLGSIYLKEERYDDAKEAFITTGTVAEKLNSKEYKSRGQIGIGQVFLSTGQYDSALYYVKAGYEVASEIKFRELMRDGSEVLGNIYEAKGDFRQALVYAKQFRHLSDSINNQQTLKLTSKLEAEHEYTKKELVLKAEFESKTTRQRWITFSVFAAFSSLLIVAWLIYRSRQKEMLANQRLQHQKQEIEKQKSAAEEALVHLKATQKQLIQSEKMASLGELTAGIAHELQNPLNFVNNFSEVSSEMIADLNEEIDKGNKIEAAEIASDLKQNLQKISQHGKRASDILTGMLQHSRPSSGKKELTDMNAIAGEYLRLAYHGSIAKDRSFAAELATDFDPSVPKLNVIPQDIGRVLLNLINNAFYAVRERSSKGEVGYTPKVTVSTRTTGGKVSVSVADNGTGIPENIREKIFQPFFTTKPTGQGTGLGLSLSYDIVKAHGGTLEVFSKADIGSEFIINFSL